MPKEDLYHIHPFGWGNDPEEERFKISTLDYLSVCTYNNYALFFRLEDADKAKAADIIRAGLEHTLSQTRQLCGTIEKDAAGGHSFVKKKDSTVQFFVQWLDSPEDADKYPSMDDIEKANFSTPSLGDLELWCVAPMTYGVKPEAHVDNSPIVSAFKANFVRGGLVLIMHHHHFANDVMGWAGETHQLAENCRAIAQGSEFPTWDPKCLDNSLTTKEEPADDAKVDGPPVSERHPDHRVGVSLLFHLPKSKAAELKKAATPTDGSWISTYDAFSAFMWRNLTRIRAPVFKPEPSANLFWVEAVDMRRRIHSPKLPARVQGNVMSAAMASTAPFGQPTVAQVISEWPFPELASYIRKLTDSVTPESLDQMLGMVAMVRDKSVLNLRIDSQPPLSILQTDHRDAKITAADFGFATPIVYRHLLDSITEGVIIVYPPRRAGPDSDEGIEISIMYEKRLAQTLIEDPEWNKYFEYRGVDAVHAVRSDATNGSS